MKVNNIFNALMQVRNKMNDSIENQLATVNSLFKGMSTLTEDVEDYVALNISEQITTSDGRVYSLSKHANEAILTITNMTDSISDTISGTLSYDSVLNILPSSAGYESIYLGDILTYVCEGEVYNEAISKITDLFLTSSNITVSDVGSAIDSINGPLTEDVNNLKYFASQISKDGKVSSYSWLSLINSITKDTKATIGASSVDFESEDPFVVRSFFSTVLAIANATLNLVLQAVVMLMNGILSIIGFIGSIISTVLSRTFNTDYAFNASVIYPGIKGTCKCSDSAFYANMQYGTYPLLNLNHRTLGSEDVYFKMKSASDRTISVLSQPILAFHPIRCVQFINYFCHPSRTIDGDYANLSFQSLFNDLIMRDDYIDIINPFLTVEEIYSCGSDSTFLQNCVKFNMLMLFFGRLMGFSCNNSVSSNPLRGRIPATSGSGVWYESLLHYLANLCYFSEQYNYNDNLFINNMSDSLDNVTLADIRALYTNVISMSNGSGLYTTLKDSVRSCCEFVNDPLGVMQMNGSDDFSTNSVITRYTYTDIVDVVPTDNICQVPEYDVSQLVAAALIVAGVITASVVGTKRIISILGAKRDIRRAKRITNLNKYRDQYLGDPSAANYQAYTQALSNYKFKSSLFGWGSYDAANGWYDGVSNVSGTAFNVTNLKYGINEIKSLIV